MYPNEINFYNILYKLWVLKIPTNCNKETSKGSDHPGPSCGQDDQTLLSSNHAYCGFWLYDNRKYIQNELQIAVQMC